MATTHTHTRQACACVCLEIWFLSDMLSTLRIRFVRRTWGVVVVVIVLERAIERPRNRGRDTNLQGDDDDDDDMCGWLVVATTTTTTASGYGCCNAIGAALVVRRRCLLCVWVGGPATCVCRDGWVALVSPETCSTHPMLQSPRVREECCPTRERATYRLTIHL